MSRVSTNEITKSSGNVFADLGLPNAEEYLVKAELAYQINKIIIDRGLKQKEAAKLLDIDQPKISALENGRLTGFSIGRLFKYLTMLNQEIFIKVRPYKEKKINKAPSASHIHVQYAAAA